jgi:hypothetical protein
MLEGTSEKCFAPTTRQIDKCKTVACSTENSAPFHCGTDIPRLQRNVAIERSGMPQASKRVAGGWSTAELCGYHRIPAP